MKGNSNDLKDNASELKENSNQLKNTSSELKENSTESKNNSSELKNTSSELKINSNTSLNFANSCHIQSTQNSGELYNSVGSLKKHIDERFVKYACPEKLLEEYLSPVLQVSALEDKEIESKFLYLAKNCR